MLEIVENDRGSTYCEVYTVRLAGALYVLHAFQKKSKRGSKTPTAEMELIRKRLQEAERHHAAEFSILTLGPKNRSLLAARDPRSKLAAAMSLPTLMYQARAMRCFAELARRIAETIDRRRLTQTEAAANWESINPRSRRCFEADCKDSRPTGYSACSRP